MLTAGRETPQGCQPRQRGEGGYDHKYLCTPASYDIIMIKVIVRIPKCVEMATLVCVI